MHNVKNTFSFHEMLTLFIVQLCIFLKLRFFDLTSFVACSLIVTSDSKQATPERGSEHQHCAMFAA